MKYFKIKLKDCFLPLDDILHDEHFPAINKLASIITLKNSVRAVCDTKGIIINPF